MCCAIFVRPPCPSFEVRFETPQGDQAQVDFAQFQVVFTDEPTETRIVWLFSFVLGYSRLIWARFVLHQDLQTLLRCHMAAFEAIGGVPHEILYDRMKTAVIGEAGGSIVYNPALIDFARHHAFQPRGSLLTPFPSSLTVLQAQNVRHCIFGLPSFILMHCQAGGMISHVAVFATKIAARKNSGLGGWLAALESNHRRLEGVTVDCLESGNDGRIIPA
jgi:hypothetical protein